MLRFMSIFTTMSMPLSLMSIMMRIKPMIMIMLFYECQYPMEISEENLFVVYEHHIVFMENEI